MLRLWYSPDFVLAMSHFGFPRLGPDQRGSGSASFYLQCRYRSGRDKPTRVIAVNCKTLITSSPSQQAPFRFFKCNSGELAPPELRRHAARQVPVRLLAALLQRAILDLVPRGGGREVFQLGSSRRPKPI
jgi:hypothetical protein